MLPQPLLLLSGEALCLHRTLLLEHRGVHFSFKSCRSHSFLGEDMLPWVVPQVDIKLPGLDPSPPITVLVSLF